MATPTAGSEDGVSSGDEYSKALLPSEDHRLVDITHTRSLAPSKAHVSRQAM